MRAVQRRNATRKKDVAQASFANGSETTKLSHDVELTDELLREERQRMIEERRREMTRVLDRHDDLVRMIYLHMYKC